MNLDKFRKDCENCTPEQLKGKLSEIELLIKTNEQSLHRMHLIRDKLLKLDNDIKYHSTELKMLKKIKTVARREAAVICGL